MEVVNALGVELKNLESLCAKLTCSRCGKLLSVFPVYYCVSVGSICGRCINDLDQVILKGWLQRATIYEFIAKELEFPCCNNHMGCEALLKWDVVVEHEDKCRGRLRCVFLDCPAEATILTGLDLNKHLSNIHKEQYRDYASNPTYEMSKTSNTFFTSVHNRVFLVVTSVEITEGWISVKCINVDHGNEHEFYKFEVETVDNLRKETIAVDCKNTNSLFSKDIYKIKIKLNRFKISIIKKSKDEIVAIENAFNIITSSKKQEVENEINKFKSGKKPCLDSASASVSSQSAIITTKLEQTETKLLEKLECHNCATYMSAPIFMCSSGHSICEDCKEKINACPDCRTPIANVRNYALENLANQFIMPCKLNKLGCQVILEGADIERHIVNDCLYNTARCPVVNCDTQIFWPNAIEHFSDYHVESLFKSGDVLEKVLTTHPSYSIILTNVVFLLRFEHKNKSVQFNCLHINLHHTNEKYAFELQFINQTNNNVRFVIRQMCKSKLADLGNDPLVLSIGSLKSFITKRPPRTFLSFRCIIFKA